MISVSVVFEVEARKLAVTSHSGLLFEGRHPFKCSGDWSHNVHDEIGGNLGASHWGARVSDTPSGV